MRRLLLLFASFVLGAVIFFWIADSVGWAGIAESISIFAKWQGWAVFFITFLVFLLSVWRWREIVRSLSPAASLKGVAGSYLAGYALMYLAPVLFFGGEAFRVYALKEKNGVPRTSGAASVFIDRFLEWTFNVIVMAVGMFFFFSDYRSSFVPPKIRLVFGAVFLACVAGLVIFYAGLFRKESVVGGFLKIFGLKRERGGHNFLEVEKEIFNFFRIGNILMWKAAVLSFLRAVLLAVRTWALVLFLGGNASAGGTMTILGFNHLAAVLPIPAALGAHEALQVLAFDSLGIPSSAAVSFALVTRSCEVIFSFIGVIILCKLGYDLMKKAIFKKIDNFKN